MKHRRRSLRTHRRTHRPQPLTSLLMGLTWWGFVLTPQLWGSALGSNRAPSSTSSGRSVRVFLFLGAVIGHLPKTRRPGGLALSLRRRGHFASDAYPACLVGFTAPWLTTTVGSYDDPQPGEELVLVYGKSAALRVGFSMLLWTSEFFSSIVFKGSGRSDFACCLLTQPFVKVCV